VGVIVLAARFRGEWPRIAIGINDFLGIYAGGRLAGTPEQFSTASYLREQANATGWTAPAILYTRLPAFGVAVRPLGALPYRTAYLAWQAMSLAAFATFILIWKTPDLGLLLFAACWSFPLFANFANGQDIAFLLLFLAIAWRWHASRPFLAGLALGMCTMKFHLFLLLPVLLVAQRRWRMLAGASAMAGVVLAVCFASAGASWPVEYAKFILQSQTNPNVRGMPNLRGLVDGLPHSTGWEIGIGVVIAVGVGWLAAHSGFGAGMSAALVGSILLSHHAYAADLLILLPALLTILEGAAWMSTRVICVLLLSPFPFFVTPAVPLAGPVPLLLTGLLGALVVSRSRGYETILSTSAGSAPRTERQGMPPSKVATRPPLR
jgi:hypothetical protein